MHVTSFKRLILLIALGLGCEHGATKRVAVLLEITVESDPGVRLGAVPIHVDGKRLGHTRVDGTLRVPVAGAPGRVLRVACDCPDGHQAPSENVSIRMRRYRSVSSIPMQVKLACRPLTRVAAFVVRASNGAGLPVQVNGELVATTNASGVAHFSRSGLAGTEYLVEIDASADPALLPRSAATAVRLPDFNELFVFTPTFRPVERAKNQRKRRPRLIKIE